MKIQAESTRVVVFIAKRRNGGPWVIWPKERC
jgi:hypothetical protein